ncbi:hypothetical protein MKX03_003298 [Papaver bracteatum]|nr:hypothetical protein MKX03_003298 [Papaver bracteatum]
MKSSMCSLFVVLLFALVCSFAIATDPGSLQDFCVAAKNPNAAVFVNGLFCKDPKLAVPEDFYLAGFNKPGQIKSPVGSLVTPANVAQIAGLNTLGISMVRIDYAPYGLNPPHTHPRATEILVVLEGTLEVGFVTSNSPDGNKLFKKLLYKGDVFVFPIGLVHFQYNVGKKPAVAIAALSSQNPGVITIANAVFGSKAPINDDILAKAFQVDKKVVDYLQSHSMGSLFVVLLFALVCSFADATDPGSLQDFCVAAKNPNSAVFVNGLFCKDPKLAMPEDFYLAGFNKPGEIKSPVGSVVTQANVAQIAGLNTLGISIVRIDYAPYGLNPPHTHPRATEILVVLEGTLEVGFVTSNSPDGNKLFKKLLYKGDVFVFPVGLIHFQYNVGKKPAVAIAALSSQNPGVITIANAVFGSKAPINDDILAKAFQVDKKVVDYLQSQFWMDN